MNIEAFQQKPWRQHGIDLTDYFNFGLDEEGWRKYCFGMVGFMTHFFFTSVLGLYNLRNCDR